MQTMRSVPSFILSSIRRNRFAPLSRNRPSHHLKQSSDQNNLQPSAPRRPSRTISIWAKWVLGSVLSLFIPSWKKKWENFCKIEENVVGVVENAAEVVEMVAGLTEKVSSKVAEVEDGEVLKEIAQVVERASKAAAKSAHLTRDFIHKVDDLKKEVETLIEPSGTHANVGGKEKHEK